MRRCSLAYERRPVAGYNGGGWEANLGRARERPGSAQVEDALEGACEQSKGGFGGALLDAERRLGGGEELSEDKVEAKGGENPHRRRGAGVVEWRRQREGAKAARSRRHGDLTRMRQAETGRAKSLVGRH